MDRSRSTRVSTTTQSETPRKLSCIQVSMLNRERSGRKIPMGWVLCLGQSVALMVRERVSSRWRTEDQRCWHDRRDGQTSNDICNLIVVFGNPRSRNCLCSQVTSLRVERAKIFETNKVHTLQLFQTVIYVLL